MKLLVEKFLKSAKGNVAMLTALMAFPLLGASGLLVDYSYLSRLESIQQEAADAAALAAAKELGVANVDEETLQGLVTAYVASNLGVTVLPADITVDATPTDDNAGIIVTVSHVWKPIFLHYINEKALPIVTSATARQAGDAKICMLGLAPGGRKSIFLKKNAKLHAKQCGIFSNSDDKESIKVEDNAELISGITCTAGGFKGAKKASFDPDPLTDCPRIDDPLAGRPVPTIGSCDHHNFKVISGFHILYPGVYCKGLKIGGTAEVQLKPGVYIITGDKLEVTDHAKLKGKGVGFYLSGNNAKLSFKKETTISLTAPETGVMAGLLMFEDRNAIPDEWHEHQITSDNARMLLGTIYLPNGHLRIDSEKAIADQSAYTAIIARRIKLNEGPVLHLNSDYEATNVPVPEGLVKDRVYLSN